MTLREQETLQDFIKRFDSYVTEDKAWKDTITAQLNPILQERMDRAIVFKFWKKGVSVLAAIIAFFVSLGMFFHYVIGPILGWK